MLSEKETEERKPLWLGMSELWLDTELDEDDFRRIAGILSESDFSLDELNYIYHNEVVPVVHNNLLCSAGEWVSFDEDWLTEQIVSRLQTESFWRKLIFQFKYRLRFSSKQWRRILRYVDELRNDNS